LPEKEVVSTVFPLLSPRSTEHASDIQVFTPNLGRIQRCRTIHKANRIKGQRSVIVCPWREIIQDPAAVVVTNFPGFIRGTSSLTFD
jgi:hypothetical protein